MPIDTETRQKVNVRINYRLVSGALHRRERRGVKDTDGTIRIIYDETENLGHVKDMFLSRLQKDLDKTESVKAAFIAGGLDRVKEFNNQIAFLQEQIDEISAL